MVKTRQWILAKKPSDLPVLEGPDATFELTETELPAPEENQVLVKLLSLSNDPAQRTWISAHIDPARHYTKPVPEGAPMFARGLAEVVESRSEAFAKGDQVLANTGWSEFAVLDAGALQPAPDLPGGLSKTHYLGALGLTGFTAYVGLTEIADVKPHDTVVVSGAAGATGMMAVQIAKKIIGCRKVIGMAGTDEKCKWVESLGADLCLNYKKDSFRSDLDAALPSPDGFADVYYDNVGGEILDLMFDRMARGGRIAACGAISTYNDSPDRATGLKKWFNVVAMRLTCRGFIVLDHMHLQPKVIELFKQSVEAGKIKVDEASENLVKGSFEDVPKSWMKLFEGGNTGKLITVVE